MSMITKLKNALNQMQEGLAHQNTTDFVPMSNKMSILGYGNESELSLPSERPARKVGEMKYQRIALVENGSGTDSALHYTIEACQRQNAEIDLLVHHDSSDESIKRMETKISESGISYRLQHLGAEGAKDISDYIDKQKSLVFMVATPDDSIVRALIEETMPRRKRQLPVPLVLIENPQSQAMHNHSQAETLDVA